MSSRDDLERQYPGLRATEYRVTSCADRTYNCFAWAAGDTRRWWEPFPARDCYWPPGVSREYSISSVRKAFETIGYHECPAYDLEAGFEKVVIYALAGIPKHAARQLASGWWTSKLCKDADIEHRLETLIDYFGPIALVLRRPASPVR